MAGSDDDASRGRRLAVGSTTGSVLIGLISAWGVWEVLMGRDAALERLASARADALTEVPAYVGDLPRGTVLTADHVALVTLPEAMVPAGTIRDPDRAVGRTLREPVLAGDLVRRERLARSHAEGLEAIVRAGMRALSIELRSETCALGVVAGTRVDVIATLPEHDGDPEQTLTVLRSVEVLAVDAWSLETPLGDTQSGASVTVQVAPAQAERAAHAIRLARSQVRLAVVGELEGLRSAPPRPVPQLGRADQRVEPARFEDRFPPALVDAMYDRYFDAGDEPPPPPVVSPVLARALARPSPERSE